MTKTEKTKTKTFWTKKKALKAQLKKNKAGYLFQFLIQFLRFQLFQINKMKFYFAQLNIKSMSKLIIVITRTPCQAIQNKSSSFIPNQLNIKRTD